VAYRGLPVRLRILLPVVILAVLAAATARAGSYYPPAPDEQPVWSPDGAQLAYLHGLRDVHVVGADGSGDRLVAAGVNTFAVSPDWRQLAVVRFLGTADAFDLEVQPLAGGEPQVVARDPLWVTPAFSPDGARIAYGATDGLRVVGADGSGSLLVGPKPSAELSWSADGTRIAFVAYGPPAHVEVALADGSGVADAGAGIAPAWSPDGSALAFVSGDSVVLVRGDARTTLPLPGGANRLRWSPDGRSLYAAATRLVRIDVATGRRTVLGPVSADFALSPTGAVAYESAGDCGDRVGIYVGARRLTDDCRVEGTAGRDWLRSSASSYQIVQGLGGDDTLVARGAPYVGDELDGGPGDDRLVGGYGPDRLDGGPGDDTITGGPNRDVLLGGPGHDRLYGQGGSDTIYARDGERDYVDCGRNTGRTNKTPELDRAYVDRFDVVVNCEKVYRSR
jgi:Ca2+-binding RTX toxin-like protein